MVIALREAQEACEILDGCERLRVPLETCVAILVFSHPQAPNCFVCAREALDCDRALDCFSPCFIDVCADDADCYRGATCEPHPDAPAVSMCQWEPACALDDDCAAGEVCFEQVLCLVPACEDDGDCGEGFTCRAGFCFP